MLHVGKAIKQLENEIVKLEAGKVSVDDLILEKQEQIKYFLTFIEEAHEEAGNKEGEPFKASRRE